MTAWRALSIDGIVYDLSHLHPRRVSFGQPAKQHLPVRHYVVQIIFGLHCFTRSVRPGESVRADWLYSDRRETRIFCVRRWGHSKRLPDIVEGLACRPCYHTGKGNFFVVELLDDDGIARDYEVYFSATRAAERGVVNLYVQSAYTRDKPQKRRYKPIRLHVILFNTLTGRPIKMPAT